MTGEYSDYDNLMIEAAHRRMDILERRIRKHHTAPTVPQYDLQAPAATTGGSTTNVLKASCDGSDAYVLKTLSPSIAPPWSVECDLFIPTSTLTATATDDFTADVLHVAGGTTGEGIFLAGWDTSGVSHPLSSGNRNWWTDQDPGNPVSSPTFTPDAWMRTLKISYDGTNVTWSVGGVIIFSFALHFAGNLSAFEVGGFSSNATTGEIYYIDNAKVFDSTSTIVFQDDFEEGPPNPLGSWTTLVGDVSTVPDPA